MTVALYIIAAGLIGLVVGFTVGAIIGWGFALMHHIDNGDHNREPDYGSAR